MTDSNRITTRLKKEMRERLRRQEEATNKNASRLIREALSLYLQQKEAVMDGAIASSP